MGKRGCHGNRVVTTRVEEPAQRIRSFTRLDDSCDMKRKVRRPWRKRRRGAQTRMLKIFQKRNREVGTVVRESSNRAMMGLTSNSETSNDHEIPNREYVVDVAHAFKYTRLCLEILGVWPMVKKYPKKWEICISKILMTICFVLLAFIMIPSTTYMILMETNLIARLMLFGPIGFCLTNILTYYSIIFRRETIKLCIEHVETDWKLIETENDRRIMIRNVNVGRNLTLFSAIFMNAGGLSYHTIMPIWRGNEINQLNETVRPLVYPGYDFFLDSQASLNYEIIFFTNCLSACVMHAVTTAACNLAAIFVTHACGQIEITMSRLENLFDGIDETSEIVKKRIGFIVNSHVRVLRLTSMIESLLREICLVRIVASTMIICLLEYYCLTEWNNSETIAIITYFFLLISLTFNVFIFCHIGELLKEQSCQIGTAAYMMEWYRLPGKTGLTLVMIIAMANSPRILTVGRMMELSVRSFGTIIKTSVVYLNMLRTMAG